MFSASSQPYSQGERGMIGPKKEILSVKKKGGRKRLSLFIKKRKGKKDTSGGGGKYPSIPSEKGERREEGLPPHP